MQISRISGGISGGNFSRRFYPRLALPSHVPTYQLVLPLILSPVVRPPSSPVRSRSLVAWDLSPYQMTCGREARNTAGPEGPWNLPFPGCCLPSRPSLSGRGARPWSRSCRRAHLRNPTRSARFRGAIHAQAALPRRALQRIYGLARLSEVGMHGKGRCGHRYQRSPSTRTELPLRPPMPAALATSIIRPDTPLPRAIRRIRTRNFSQRK